MDTPYDSSAQEERPGPEPRIHDEQAETKARALDRSRRGFLERSMREPLGPKRPLGASLVLLVCAWVFLAQGALYPNSAVGERHVVLDVVVAIVLALAALRLLLGGPRRWLSALVGLGGVVLVLFGLFLSHDSTAVQISEITCGVVVIIGALMTLDRRPTATNHHTPDTLV
jgi:drug/metabolite transporter (DMT)-like permease